MDVLAAAPFTASSIEWQNLPAQWMLTVVCKATYTLRPGTSPLATERDPIRPPCSSTGVVGSYPQALPRARTATLDPGDGAVIWRCADRLYVDRHTSDPSRLRIAHGASIGTLSPCDCFRNGTAVRRHERPTCSPMRYVTDGRRLFRVASDQDGVAAGPDG